MELRDLVKLLIILAVEELPTIFGNPLSRYHLRDLHGRSHVVRCPSGLEITADTANVDTATADTTSVWLTKLRAPPILGPVYGGGCLGFAWPFVVLGCLGLLVTSDIRNMGGIRNTSCVE
jgi:hypothetical protein